MITKNLIQFWHDFESLPENIAQAMSVTQSHHNDYEIIQADDNFIQNLILRKYNKAILQLYQLNKIPASRSDIARLMLLKEYGEVYIDADFELNNSFNQFINDSSEIILVQRDDLPHYKTCPEKAHIMNGILGATSKHPFINWCLQRAIRNLAYGEHNKRTQMATGPAIIDQAYDKFKQRYKIKKLSFDCLQNEFFSIRTTPGVSNSWMTLQRDGIIDQSFYNKNRRNYEKLWVVKNKIFHFSFNFISFSKKPSTMK
jgi:mannosyltransferase OCH1-like enzyme